ncbi:uncharacterized protein METZ01_LOCUS428596, partial [marine metagenome]
MSKSPQNALNLANLSTLNKYSKQDEEHLFIDELNKVVALRPFHPEAYLRAVDYYLELGSIEKAQYYNNILLQLTPNWDLPIKISKTFKKRSKDRALLLKIKYKRPLKFKT